MYIVSGFLLSLPLKLLILNCYKNLLCRYSFYVYSFELFAVDFCFNAIFKEILVVFLLHETSIMPWSLLSNGY